MKSFKDKRKVKKNLKSSKKIFGVCFRDQSDEVPYIITHSISFLEQKALGLEGIFRLSGNHSLIAELKTRFDKGEKVDFFKENLDPHTVAGLLKLYFRELPEPLLTFDLYDMFLAAVSINEPATQLLQVKKVLQFLPRINQIVVVCLASFLHQVHQRCEENKMHPANLAIIFAPNLLRCENNDIGIMIEDTPYANELMIIFLQHFDTLFKDYKTPEETPTPKSKLSQPEKKEELKSPDPGIATKKRPPVPSTPLPPPPVNKHSAPQQQLPAIPGQTSSSLQTSPKPLPRLPPEVPGLRSSQSLVSSEMDPSQQKLPLVTLNEVPLPLPVEISLDSLPLSAIPPSIEVSHPILAEIQSESGVVLPREDDSIPIVNDTKKVPPMKPPKPRG